MAEFTIQLQQKMVTKRCWRCDVVYAVTEEFNGRRHDDKETFYCPNGHGAVYMESDADKLRRERDLLKQQIARIEDDRAAAWRAEADAVAGRKKAERELKRTMTRAGAGVCPCCNRSFVALARHMKTRHPEISVINDKTKRTIPG